MVRFNAQLCLGLLPATAIATSSALLGHGVRRATYHHHHYRRPSLAFGRSLHLSLGEPSVKQPSRPPPVQSTLKIGSEARPQELATAPSSLLESVTAVASDVDGTLTTPDVTVSHRTVSAVKAVLDSEVLFFPATGKTRVGMYQILGEEISSHLRVKNAPGVFIQGLVVYSGSGDEVLYERLLDTSVVKQVVKFCEEKGVSLIAYSGDRIVCSINDEQTERIAHYKEPMPEAVGPLVDAMESGLKIHKLILMGNRDNIDRIWPEMEQQVGNQATLTQALPGMLEVLPQGESKGNGVQILLKHLGIDPTRLMALGDAENDVDMLRLAGIGVCVGNASPPAKAAARFIAPSNSEDGAAVAMERMLSCRNSLTQ